MVKSVGVAILAAGQGTRMKIDIAKPLAPVVGKKLVDFPINAASNFFQNKNLDGEITLITGHMRDAVESYVNENYENIKFAVQEKQLGTADALRSYFKGNIDAKNKDYTIVLCADTPLIRDRDLERLYDLLINNNLDGVLASFLTDTPKGYGRIVRGEKGFIIVEEKDATDEIRKIKEVNSGLYILKTSFVLKHLDSIGSNNNSKEFYLTDLFQKEFMVQPLLFENGTRFIGVNDLSQLEFVGKELQKEKNHKLMLSGVRMIDSLTTYIDWDVEVLSETVIHPNVSISGKTKIGKNVLIESGCVIKNSYIEDSVAIYANSYMEDATVKNAASIGPFARLRSGSDIGDKCKIGNFVETKKAKLEKGAKVSHLSYVGDALIGENSNIGCGFITCNYDGANKHFTKIGKNCFIGSDSQTVAPVEIGDGSFIACATTVTESVSKDSFVISRGKQITKENMGHKFIKKK